MHRSLSRPKPIRLAEPLLALSLLLGAQGCASTGQGWGPVVTEAGDIASAEAAAVRAFDAVRGDSARLYAFLLPMPKGGDLHSHLSGAVYAESYLEWAAEDGLCLTVATLSVTGPPCDAAAGRPPVADVQRNAALRAQVIDAFSTRNYRPEVEQGGDRFFSAFGRFGAVSSARPGDMLAEAAARAARGQLRYLELMHAPASAAVTSLGAGMEWGGDMLALRRRLLDAGLLDSLALAIAALDGHEARRDTLLGCGGSSADPGCRVTIRYQYRVQRTSPREVVFTQILAGFELAVRDPRFVSLNLVQREEDRVSLRDYSLHMRMIAFLSELYPDVPVTLHAGELKPGLVPPEDLRFHVREAVGVAGARRIGHGLAVLYEDDPDALLRLMAQRRILVETNLSSNDIILGVRGARHPLRTFLAYGVPVALSTDDEGVARSEMTIEYRKAVEEQGVDYVTLKGMARNSLEYAFVEGASLWDDYDTLTPVAPCTSASGGLDGAACRAFTARNEKARLQASLELDYRAFEARVAAGAWPWAAGVGR